MLHLMVFQHRGHVVGSHSCSHPEWMAKLEPSELLREWTESCKALSDVTGVATTTASVPGGYFSTKVAEAAAQAGIEVLFTSEPTPAVQMVGGCMVLGRYTVRRSTPASVVGAIAAGEKWPRYLQTAAWSLNKAAKKISGPGYLTVRRLILARVYGH